MVNDIGLRRRKACALAEAAIGLGLESRDLAAWNLDQRTRFAASYDIGRPSPLVWRQTISALAATP